MLSKVGGNSEMVYDNVEESLLRLHVHAASSPHSNEFCSLI